MKKVISFIMSITICTALLGAEFKEVTPLEKNIVAQNETIKEEVKENTKPTEKIEVLEEKEFEVDGNSGKIIDWDAESIYD